MPSHSSATRVYVVSSQYLSVCVCVSLSCLVMLSFRSLLVLCYHSPHSRSLSHIGSVVTLYTLSLSGWRASNWESFHKACNSSFNQKANFFAGSCWSFSDTLQQTDLLWLIKSLRQSLCTKTAWVDVFLTHSFKWAWSSEHPHSSLNLISVIIPFSDTVVGLWLQNLSLQITQQSSWKLLAAELLKVAFQPYWTILNEKSKLTLQLQASIYKHPKKAF